MEHYHTLKNTANQKVSEPLHICMQFPMSRIPKLLPALIAASRFSPEDVAGGEL